MFIKLIKKTIEKKYTQIKDQRTAYGYFSSIVGITLNIILFAVKLSVGLFTNSISLIADSINNLSDTATGIVGFIGFKMSIKPADKEHPFGHGRTEYISSLVVSFIILIIGYELIRDSFERIMHPSSLIFNWTVFIILIITIIAKLWLSHFYATMARQTHSHVLKTASVDSLNDVWATGSVLISFIVHQYFQLKIDGYMGVLVALFIMYNGFTFIRESMDTIIGDKPDKKFIGTIRQYISHFDGIISVHDIIVHDYGPMSKMVTAHVEISSTLSLLVAHEIIDRIEQSMKEDLGVSLLLHMDPIEINCQKTIHIKNEVMHILRQLHEIKSIYDFRVIEEENHTTVIFQLNIDEESEKDENVYKDVVLCLLNENLTYRFIIDIKKENHYM
ncbi:MAG: cation diffusion facilitator family transporter [Eubacteriales bacterium]